MNTSDIINIISKKRNFLNSLPVMNSTREALSNSSDLEMTPIQNSHPYMGLLYLFIIGASAALFGVAFYIIRQNDKQKEPDRQKDIELDDAKVKKAAPNWFDRNRDRDFTRMTVEEFYASSDTAKSESNHRVIGSSNKVK